jgi:septal ring factor EnvC (AmiA/AmiB activator)
MKFDEPAKAEIIGCSLINFLREAIPPPCVATPPVRIPSSSVVVVFTLTVGQTKSDWRQPNLKSADSNLESTDSNLKSTDSNLESTDSNLKSTDSNLESTDSNLKSADSNAKDRNLILSGGDYVSNSYTEEL